MRNACCYAAILIMLMGCERAPRHAPPNVYNATYECKELRMAGYSTVRACKLTNNSGKSVCEIDWRMTIPCEFYEGVR